MPFVLPALPFAMDALSPHISANTLSFHHGKHHQAYVTNLNGLIEGSELADKSLEDIILATAGKADKAGIFNNAAQTWNHTFFWNSLSPTPQEPSSTVLTLINQAFGSIDKFKEEFKKAGATQFGSGWAWLIQRKDGKLEIVKTSNAETPLTTDATPLLTCDVWEHAYYLDYQNRRTDFLQVFVDHLINWDFVAANLKSL
ncbi:MAG: superoxide dismutase [Bdellovibrionales bacterium]